MRWVLLTILPSGSSPCAPAAAEPFEGVAATFRIINDADGAIPKRIVSFGQVFRRGQVTPIRASHPREPAFAIALATSNKD